MIDGNILTCPRICGAGRLLQETQSPDMSGFDPLTVVSFGGNSRQACQVRPRQPSV